MSNTFRQHRFKSPPGSTDILLIRHGESAAADPDNPFPTVNGHGDPPLHACGLQQAELVGTRLSNEPIDAIYISNLQRTAQTAGPLSKKLNLEPNVLPDLREVFLGEYEGGIYRQKMADNDQALRNAFREHRWDLIPGAESNEEFERRLKNGLETIASAHPNELIAAFVHGAVIAQILSTATRARPMAFTGADNGSISHIVIFKDRITVRCFNDTTHLDPHYSNRSSAIQESSKDPKT